MGPDLRGAPQSSGTDAAVATHVHFMKNSTQKDVFDVAILGAGFSGCILATLLARQGVRVVLIDAGTHPRFSIGESTIPHTSLLLSLLAERFDVPEIDHLAYPDKIAAHVCSTCGIKRAFGFAYHRAGEAYDPRHGIQFGTSSKDENHFFRQDVDAYLFHVALRYGVVSRLNTRIGHVDIAPGGVVLTAETGEAIEARFVVDGTGYRSVLARQFALRLSPPPLLHHARTLFTHMIDVAPFEDDTFPLPWNESTLHHVFERGWIWVIPFGNRDGSTNPLTSVGLTLDPRRYPRTDRRPDDEFRDFLRQFPAVASQFSHAKAVRPWVATDRLQYASVQSTGYRYCLMSHAAGFVDPLFSRGLINTLEGISALMQPLLEALNTDDFDEAAFEPVDALQQRVLAYNDRLVNGAFIAFHDFDLWNAWLRVWALGTIITEYRLMNALADECEGRPAPATTDCVFSDHEDPDYAAFFNRVEPMMRAFERVERHANETSSAIFEQADAFPFPVPLRRDAMRRAGWLRDDEVLSDRNLHIAREGYRWALTNPDSRDLFGRAETFFRWRAHHADPHLANDLRNG